MRLLLSTFMLCLGLAAGCWTALSSWNGVFFVSNSKYIAIRNPAYAERAQEFSQLRGRFWTLLSRDRLLSEAAPVKEFSRTGVVLGHFITQDSAGKNILACDLYNRVQLTFVAEGVAVAGEQIKMNVEAPCRATSNLDLLEPIWIPHAEILRQSPAPALDLDFPGDNVHITFSQLSTEWPRNWVLNEVKLLQDSNEAAPVLRVTAEQIRHTAKSPIFLQW